ncbi:hypothetical protein D7W81_18825 [Corallococcus aberystwythensis]|uniref:Uncharacterized protein n=1 Tax=Corallococcus aberystwythensis TaxID=2316722 RepID=A0A3A8Q9Q3_9BACT|nr:hypothetical protein D7W81_18825 [Corallococcus aberystwythensis]
MQAVSSIEVNQTGGACVPTTCAAQGRNCGTLNCGTCGSGQTCSSWCGIAQPGCVVPNQSHLRVDRVL